MNHANLKIDELEEDGGLRLRLTGELDLAAASGLEERLAELSSESVAVRLDLSELDFIDSSGVHVLIRAMNDARTLGWQLEVDPNLSPAVRRVFELVQLDRYIAGDADAAR